MTKSVSKSALPIVILTGGQGRTAKLVLAAALAQFGNPPAKIVLRPNIRKLEFADQIVRQAAQDGAIVVHTLVDPQVRGHVTQLLSQLNVPAVDLLGSLLTLLADHFDEVPRGQAGLLYALHKEQFDRIEAVDFTLAHDDGQRVYDLDKADIVLVGVSRVSKSVTCFYLASRGIRAANVPITMEQELPDELERLDPKRVIGLTMTTARLCALRQSRLDRLTQRSVGGYVERSEVLAELRHASRLMQQYGWRSIDVSYKSTEEVASEIVSILAPLTTSLNAYRSTEQ